MAQLHTTRHCPGHHLTLSASNKGDDWVLNHAPSFLETNPKRGAAPEIAAGFGLYAPHWHGFRDQSVGI